MKKLLPVIHCQDWKQTRLNIGRAGNAGADGVFLINHKIPHQFLSVLAERAVKEFPGFPIGLNYLDLDPILALSVMPAGITALWTDEPYLTEKPGFPYGQAQMFLDYREARESEVCYYGSVAFKYKPPVVDLKLMTAIAAKYMEVVTTSGDATGHAAPVSKIKTMKEVLGEKSLALASGVDSENVHDYLPYVDDFLVASGISYDFLNLNEKKVKELADIIHAG
jgi:predicted TIM-barrel enzyme